MSVRCAGIIALAATLTAGSRVRAAALTPDAAELVYDRPTGLTACPDEAFFRHFVAARFAGVDPFKPGAPRKVTVRIQRSTDAFLAEVALVEAGQPQGETLTETNCTALVEAAGRRVFTWLLPDETPAPAPPVPTEPHAPSAPEEPPAKPLDPPAPPPPLWSPGRFVPRIGAGARAEFGEAWGAIFGVIIEGGVQRKEWRWGGWSVMGAFRLAPQQPGIGPPTAGTAVDVNSLLIAGSVTGCVHRAWPVSLAGCIVGEGGEIQQAAGTSARPYLHQTAMFAGGGIGARIEVPLADRVYAQMSADALGVARLAGGTKAWGSFGAAAGGLGAGVGVSF